ncbi:CubicO group peptidase (beta-lactamase class C family) [Algoriphagus ratkowskyi]|uniref:Beta-lactamase family protein n=1 Tax=Algoriphagus ratkowskyi TaxID=57028 RepID=A0A2W7RKZ6_9BACT|nr:serine hydrolase domain-containing protein [Algoriphagus ratkowskyi]PZX59160.1 CubicO group peptidase (beta-lactamase class C family) [Algoriphagus ratkowskyi]TXD77556.1 beta-lactamase family protein [Algoriphagus ratkowskyi]
MKKYFSSFTSCFLLLILSNTVLSQTPSTKLVPQGNQPLNGVSATRLDRIDQMLDQTLSDNQVPGLVALIVKDGKIVYHEAKGFADVPSGTQMAKDQIFRIASQTKAITSTAVMMLWEEGKFKLDDPISKFIPEFSDPQILTGFRNADSSFSSEKSPRQITIRHLITHTSGIGYGMIDGNEQMKMIYAKAGIVDLFTTEPVKISDNIKKLAKLPLHHAPGTKYTYSEGLDVLGYFIEVISGMPFDEFLQTRIFDPMGMKNTGFYLNEAQGKKLVTIHRKMNNQWESYPMTFYDPDYPKTGSKTFFSGGAGLSSTAEDYAKFLQMYLNGGVYNGTRFLSSTTIKTIMSNQVGDLLGNGGKDYGLAFGLVDENGVTQGGIGSLGTFDWGGYFNTQYFADPVTNTIGILMKQTQGGTGDESAWKFRQMVFAAIE